MILALTAMLLAGPAAMRATNGCAPASAVVLSNGEADCADGEVVRSDAPTILADQSTTSPDAGPAPVASPVPEAKFVNCADEHETCRGKGWGEVQYGAASGGTYRITVQGDVRCDNDVLGDPSPGDVKRCMRRPVSAPLLPADISPIASDFAAGPLILGGVGQATSGKPDVVGAFRMICTSGQINYDDPILYPGVRGGSPHLHQWFGNITGRYDSVYASLRGAGDSTCSNKLNRSAYWIPALLTGAGKVLAPDYISLYYKRRPDGDPECLRMALKGCVDLPTGLRAVSGYDMRRMHEKQPANMTFHFRCNAVGKPGDHRGLIAQAVADCGGSGQIMAVVDFGACWNGMLDSADHRSHLTGASYGSWGYPKCPATHPYVIPGLTQGVAYTITPGDGDLHFASDLMPGMKMPGGSTFHADYMEAWDPPTRGIWERQCIGKLLNCSDGNLGDGTMLKRPNLTYKPAVRLIEAPGR